MPTPAASRSERRTPAQNNALWSLMAQLTRASGLSKEELEPTLRESVRRASGQEHTSQLTVGQAERVLADLRAQLARYAPAPKVTPGGAHRPADGTVTGGLTERQRVYVDGLFDLLGWGLPQRVGFIKRQCGGALQPRTQAHVNALIHALDRMVTGQIKPREAWDRVRALSQHPGLSVWARTIFIPDILRKLQEAEAGGTLDTVLTPGMLAKIGEIEAQVAR